MADPILNTLSLCSGVGMLDVGVTAGLEHLGIASRTVAYAEWEAYAASQLIALMDAGALDAAPVWCGDLGRLDGASFRGRVDAIVAGFPCQPHSVAGKRGGVDDERWIWADIERIIRDSGCWLVVLENVSGLLSSGGMDPVLASLADLGFAAEYVRLSGEDVGASHRRERIFIVGLADTEHDAGRAQLRAQSWRGRATRTDHVAGARRSSAIILAECEGGGFGDLWQSSGSDGQPDRGNEAMADTSGRLVSESGRGSKRRNGAGSTEPDVADSRCSAPQRGELLAGTGGRATEHRACGGEVEDATWDGGDRPHGESGRGRGVCGASGEVGDAEGQRHLRCEDSGTTGKAEEGWQRRAQLGDGCGALADSECEGRGSAPGRTIEPGQQAYGDEDRTGLGECSGNTIGRFNVGGIILGAGTAELADAEREGSQGLGLGDEERRRIPESRSTDWRVLPLFAPGPADARWAGLLGASRVGAWERAVTDDEAGTSPWAPATKPGVRVLADGLALLVDESRRDQLRAGGNGVVALQAAVGTIGLVRRLIE